MQLQYSNKIILIELQVLRGFFLWIIVNLPKLPPRKDPIHDTKVPSGLIHYILNPKILFTNANLKHHCPLIIYIVT